MKKLHLTFLLTATAVLSRGLLLAASPSSVLSINSSSAITQPADPTSSQDPGNSDSSLGLTKAQLLSLGYRIWTTQSNESVDAITQWDGSDAQHQFMYLGIAQNIWCPVGYDSIFSQDWPVMAEFLKENGYHIKKWMLGPCPWNNQDDFNADFDGKKMTWLRTYLSKEKLVRAQAFFIAERLHDAILPTSDSSMLKGLSADEAALVTKNFNLVANAQDPFGYFALIDYVNFKGEGTLGSETFNGHSWGLLQVLQNMDEATIMAHPDADGHPADLDVMQAFVDAAKLTLWERIENHKIQDSTSNDIQYWNMWCTHVDSYLQTNAEVAASGADQPPSTQPVTTAQ